MSSSSDRAVRSTVLRHVIAAPAPELVEVGSLSGPGRRAVDPVALEEALRRGYADGYERGLAEGRTEGRREATEQVLAESRRQEATRAQEVAAATAALERAADEARIREGRSLAEIEDAVVAAAFELATALVGRELELSTSPGRDALARALRLVDEGVRAEARLHPEDLATLGDYGDLPGARWITVSADPSVERGGCVLEVGAGRIDAQLGAAVRRVAQELGT